MFLGSILQENVLRSDDPGFSFYPKVKVFKIYVRSHYEHLMTKITSSFDDPEKIIILTGTPGVGKSLFAVYMVKHMIDNQQQYPNITSIVYRRYVTGNITYYAFKYQGNQWVKGTVDLTSPPSLYICDDSGHDFATLDGCPNIFITSPRVRF